MDRYLTYDEFKDLGGRLTELDFNRSEIAARSMIDVMTFNRLQGENPMREKVKYLMLELIVRKYVGNLDGIDIASHSTGRTSVSYNNSKGRAENLIRTYLQNERSLNGTPLLYAGNL